MRLSPFESRHVLPLIYTNLASEMLYVLAHRLEATNMVGGDKKQKVLLSMVEVMFAKQFVKDTLLGLDYKAAPSRHTMKAVFSKLMRYSPLKMGETSFSKMYDLMMIATKSQIYLCQRPEDILLVGLNHLDGVKDLLAIAPYGPAIDQVELVNQMTGTILELYKDLTPAQYMGLRQMMLTFFQDTKIRVSVLLKEGLQNEHGHFIRRGGGRVAPGYEPPGPIRMFQPDGKIESVSTFPIDYKYEGAAPPPVLTSHGKRHTNLGRNMYMTWDERNEDSPPRKEKDEAEKSASKQVRPPAMSPQKAPELEGVSPAALQAAQAEARMLRSALGLAESLPEGVRAPLNLELDLQIVEEPGSPQAAEGTASVPKEVLDFSKFRERAFDDIWKEFSFVEEKEESKSAREELADLMDSVS